MAFQAHNYVLDDTLLLNTQATGSTTGSAVVGSNGVTNLVIDLGQQARQYAGLTGATDTSSAAPYAEFDVVVDWTGCEIGTGDEIYYVSVEGSMTSNFSTTYNLHKRTLGTSSDQPHDTPNKGRLVMHCDNVVLTNGADINVGDEYGTVYRAMRYVRISVFVSGTVTTGLAYKAWLVPKQ